MNRIVVKLPRAVRRRLRRVAMGTRDSGLRTRILVVLHYASGAGCERVAAALGIHAQSAARIARRFLEQGEAGLHDGRSHNGTPKVDADLLEALSRLVRGSPQDHGWHRPTWTRELLAKTLLKETGVSLSVTTIQRMLVTLRARWGMPRPIVACPWKKGRRLRRMRRIRALLGNLPSGEIAFYQDEADVDLNPKLGRDWMLFNTQKLVLTPGKNQKRYLAGALSSDGRELHVVSGRTKNSKLFLDLLAKLRAAFPRARRIHLVLDNYVIHSSRRVRRYLESDGRRFRLHFLPPYSPNDNKIEMVWKDLHANVTRNHRCTSIEQLTREARAYLRRRQRARAWVAWFARPTRRTRKAA